MDDDLTHAAIQRFEALEERVAALEAKGSEADDPGFGVEVDDEDGENVPTPTPPAEGY